MIIGPVVVGFDGILETTRWPMTLTPNLTVGCVLAGIATDRSAKKSRALTDEAVRGPKTTVKGGIA